MPRARPAKRHPTVTAHLLSGGFDPRVRGRRRSQPPRFWTQVLTGGLWRWRGEPAAAALLAALGPSAPFGAVRLAAIAWALAANTVWLADAGQAAVHAAGALLAAEALQAPAAPRWAPLLAPFACEFAGGAARRAFAGHAVSRDCAVGAALGGMAAALLNAAGALASP